MPAMTSIAPTVFVFGSVNIDLVCRVEAIARPGETVLSPRYDQLFGGKGANQAVAAARASKVVPVAFVGAVGDDDLGRAAREQMQRDGIDVTRLHTGTERTGCAFITIDSDGENSITVASGANLEAKADWLDPALFGQGTVLVLQMEIPLQENIAAATSMTAAGGRVIVNLAPVPSSLGADDLAQLLASTAVLVVNESELKDAAKLARLPNGDFPGMAAALAFRFCIEVIATLGAEGVLIAGPSSETQHLEAMSVDVVDTTGAGDTFVGALASGLAHNLSTQEAARRAAVAASLACRKVGAQTAMPTASEIDAALTMPSNPAP